MRRVNSSQASPAERALGRATTLAYASGMALLILAGLSTLVNLLHPFSASFLISIVALGCGVVEWRTASRLAARDPRAPRRLACNQLVLGAGILLYGLWQANTLPPSAIFAVLQRPYLRPVLDWLPPEQVELLHELLPPMMRATYFAVALLGGLGCAGMAWYFASRGRLLRELPGNPVGA